MIEVADMGLGYLEMETLFQVDEIRKKGNFQTVKKELGCDKIKLLLTALYPKYNITQIEEITGIPDSTLETWFNKLKIPLVRNHLSSISKAGDKDKEKIVKRGKKAFRISTIKITPELSYLIGFALGDGSIEKFYVDFFNQDKGILEKVLLYLSMYGKVGEKERDDGLWMLRLSSKRIANLIKSDKKIRKDTINYIFDDLELAQMFTAAFWDAEGSVLKNGNCYSVYLYNSNKWIMDKISTFLRRNNIDSSMLEMKSRKGIYYLNSQAIIAKKKIHRLSIPKKSLSKWTKLIGVHLVHSKKREIVNLIQKEEK